MTNHGHFPKIDRSTTIAPSLKIKQERKKKERERGRGLKNYTRILIVIFVGKHSSSL